MKNDSNQQLIHSYQQFSDEKNCPIKIVENILTNYSNNGQCMKIILYLFHKHFLTDSKYLKNIISTMTKLNVKSSESNVYISTFLPINKIIVKTPKNPSFYKDIDNEYLIGLIINKLRMQLPNFVYTFGKFNIPTPYIINEYINGNDIEILLKKDKLSFTQFMGIFIQILLALEVSQRSINFCHFDLHTKNIILKKIKTFKYNILLDTKNFEITSSEYLPVFIDFGLSSVNYEDTVMGSHYFPNHGMMHYLLPGVDMYKFLVFSCTYASKKLRLEIIQLFDFYGKDDPYNLVYEIKNLTKAAKNFAKKGSFSKIATYTPLDFLSWILNKPNYDNISKQYIKIKQRNLLVQTGLNSILEIQEIPKLSTKSNTGYIDEMYYKKIIPGYKPKLDFNRLIKQDKRILNSYKNIQLPLAELGKVSDQLLKIKISSKINKKDIETIVCKYKSLSTFYSDIELYLEMIYMIRELNLEEIYQAFLNSFLSSKHYKIYIKHQLKILRTLRWCDVLLVIK